VHPAPQPTGQNNNIEVNAMNQQKAKKIEDLGEKTLRDTDTYRVPVPIHLVAERLDLTMEAAALGEKVSGMIVVKGERGAIGYNSAHPRVRQRFTISHEIAHFLLHARKDENPQLFIDGAVAFRPDKNTSTTLDNHEVEANHLAAALLMPRALVREEMRKRDLDLDDEDAIISLAKEFHAGAAAMSNRLFNLGVLR
jgi:Zn-dependent peptidase ImmA (M78 family)